MSLPECFTFQIISCEFVARVLLCCFCCSRTSPKSLNFSLKPNSTSMMPARCPADCVHFGRRPVTYPGVTQRAPYRHRAPPIHVKSLDSKEMPLSRTPFSTARWTGHSTHIHTSTYMYINKNSTICAWAVSLNPHIYIKMRIKGGKTLNEILKYIWHFAPSVHIRKVNNYLSAIC